MGHIQSSLGGFHSLRVIEREDNRHKYLMLKYDNGLEVPSWKASDGTLRFMALTLLAYMPQATGLYMIEEPENGIHPGALQSVFHSLSSVYDAQVLLATHSPEFVAIADVEHLLIFGKTVDGVVDIVSGPSHPRLKEWKNEIDLGTFFAMGILA
jgi:predicted ATPase